MRYPDVQVIANQYTESVVYAVTVWQLMKNVFALNGMYVLPELLAKNSLTGKTIILPEIGIPVNEVTRGTVGINRTNAIFHIASKIEKSHMFPVPVVENRQRYMNERFMEFWNHITMVFNENFYKDIAVIEIWVSKIGAGGSTLSPVINKMNTLTIVTREDMPESSIFGTILLAFMSRTYEQMHFHVDEFNHLKTWVQRYTNVPSVATEKESQKSTIAKELVHRYEIASTAYLKKIGCILITSLCIKDNLLSLGNRSIAITPTEVSLLSYFTGNKGKLLSNQDIHKAIMSGKPFSLAAITKLVQRCREKLRKVGYSLEYIETVNGKGYKFLDSNSINN